MARFCLRRFGAPVDFRQLVTRSWPAGTDCEDNVSAFRDITSATDRSRHFKDDYHRAKYSCASRGKKNGKNVY